MGIAIKGLLLIGLIRILSITNSPVLCACIYGGAVFIWRLFGGTPLLTNVLFSGISLALAFGYFWVLDRFEGYNLIWWPVLIIGLLIGLV